MNDNQHDGRIGRMPAAINKLNPTPNADAKQITKVVKQKGRISGYELSDGQVISKQQGVELAKSGGISGVGVATRKGNEYLRTLPDDQSVNNLSDLPTISG